MKKNIYISFLVFFISVLNVSVFSQNDKVEILKESLKHERSYEKKSEILYEISNHYYIFRDENSALKYADLGLDMAKNKNKQTDILKFMTLKGKIFYASGDFKQSTVFYQEVLFLSFENKDRKHTADAYLGLGKSMWRLGKYNESVYFSTEAIKIYEELEDNFNLANCKGNLGSVYIDIGDFGRATEIYNNILPVYENLQDSTAIANVYEKLGAIKFYKGYYPHARKYYNTAYEIYKGMNKDLEAAIELGNIAETYEMEKKYTKAVKHYNDAIKIEKDYKYSSGLIFLYQALGRTYLKIGNRYKAKESYFKCIDIINEIGEIRELPNVYKLIYELYESAGDYRNAYKYALMESAINDSISGLSVKNQINEIRIKYDTEKKEKENTFLRKNKIFQEEKSQRQNLLLMGLISFILIIIIGSLFLYKLYRKNKKTGHTLENKNDQLNTVYKDITDSIAYAGNIQKALLSSFKEIRINFTDYFVLYEPAHVLSGDFYWSKKINDIIFIVVADSTGHGIPGALISILGMSLLNEIIDEDFIQTDIILNNLREKIKKALNQKGEIGEQKDGWDLSIVSININTGEAQFSGAFNSVYLIPCNQDQREGVNDITELAADRQPVSIYQIEKPFRKQNFKLKKGDMLYLFTDGYTDQLNHLTNKRFTSKRFKELLSSVSGEKMNKQIEIIKETFFDWKGDFEQVDDVLIMGLKI